MKHKTKQLISGILCGVMVFSMAAATAIQAFAADTQVLYETDFEDGCEGWQTGDADGDGKKWVISVFDDGILSTGKTCLVSNSFSNDEGELTPDNWLYSPTIHIPETGQTTLRYKAFAIDMDNCGETYAVYIADNGKTTGIFQETLKDGDHRLHPVVRTLDLSDYAGKDINIWFRHFDSVNIYALGIDDISVTWSSMPFSDVKEGAYYETAVEWACENNITTGVDAHTFMPDKSCSRAETVTFLWRMAGCPAPEGNAIPFTDVPETAYYHDAVAWAYENGVTTGITDTKFGVDETCTRAQTVTFLYRIAGQPQVNTDSCSFTDVSADAYYMPSVLWAYGNHITEGYNANAFGPHDTCTRAQIVTFLYRFAQK